MSNGVCGLYGLDTTLLRSRDNSVKSNQLLYIFQKWPTLIKEFI